MTAAGLGLNNFCYAGLIMAHLNKTPRTEDTASKVNCIVHLSSFVRFDVTISLKRLAVASLGLFTGVQIYKFVNFF